jgi:hypothetical protein
MREWQAVIFSGDCDEEGNCPLCLIDYADCPCPGPTMDEEYEYRENPKTQVLEARRKA